MYQIQKTVDFEAAHRLWNYSGKCRNLHGHSYKARIKIEASELNSDGEVYIVDRV